jgi:hypothetical protein
VGVKIDHGARAGPIGPIALAAALIRVAWSARSVVRALFFFLLQFFLFYGAFATA